MPGPVERTRVRGRLTGTFMVLFGARVLRAQLRAGLRRWVEIAGPTESH